MCIWTFHFWRTSKNCNLSRFRCGATSGLHRTYLNSICFNPLNHFNDSLYFVTGCDRLSLYAVGGWPRLTSRTRKVPRGSPAACQGVATRGVKKNGKYIILHYLYLSMILNIKNILYIIRRPLPSFGLGGAASGITTGVRHCCAQAFPFTLLLFACPSW